MNDLCAQLFNLYQITYMYAPYFEESLVFVGAGEPPQGWHLQVFPWGFTWELLWFSESL